MSQSSDNARHAQFLRLYTENEAALLTFVRSMLTSRQEAADVMQEVSVILWQKFAEAHEFRPWAFGVARHVALRHLRSQSRDRHVFDDDLVSRLADEAAAMDQRHLTQREALTGCLQKLPAAQRELALSAYTKGTRMDDLAASRGQTPMSLYKMLHRIRQALLECVRRTLTQEDLS